MLNMIRLALAIVLACSIVVLADDPPATAPAATQAATQPAANAMKVGWVVSQSTFDQPIGHGLSTRFDSVTAIRQRFLDPEIDLYAIIEPGTEGNDELARLVSENFPADHVIDGTDVNTLSTLNVIVCSRDWAVKDEVLEGIAKAVEGGVGLLRHLPLRAASEEHTEISDKLQCLTDTEYFHERAPTECRVVSDHPLLHDLRKTLEGGKLPISALNGTKGILHGTPLIVVDGDVTSLGNVDTEGNPVAGKEVTAPGDAKIFAPLFVAQIGKGRVIACQWDSLPKPIIEATQGRFYIHCCQWLANRPIH
jgi:hypothetical protein